MARLNAHSSIQAFPEILAPICSLGQHADVRHDAIQNVLRQLQHGSAVESFTAAYSKLGPEADNLPVRGFKTRLNSAADLGWYERVGRPQNFYQVEPSLLLPMLEAYGFRLVRLRRDNLVRQAVSWLRAVRLASDRDNLWNIPRGDVGLGPLSIEPILLVHTIAWLGTARVAHDIAYETYRGPKLLLSYESLFSAQGNGFEQLFTFLGVALERLEPFHDRATASDLSSSITNYDEIAAHLRSWGMDDQLTM